jgi:S-adenosylmethionine:tRNA ribosyltransferase-isomerase
MRIEEFDYPLPPSLIAQYPSSQRGNSSLMVLRRSDASIEHRVFQDLLDYLRPGDLLITNNTRVIPARLFGKKETGGKIEMLAIPSWNGARGEWEVMFKGSRKVKQGVRIQFDRDLYGEVEELKGGRGKIRFPGHPEMMDILRRLGHIPLPPYIKRQDEVLDGERYQTVFAEKDGSIAAPTAGLHFTSSLLQSIKDRGAGVTSITLHVGIGTFLPVKSITVEEHTMEKEWVEIHEDAKEGIERTRTQGGRVIAVGTTAARALESFSDGDGGVKSGRGMTSLFIYPPYRFSAIDGLVTNFHLPRSTLIMLVAAFAGKDLIMKAYREAVKRRYRFYSYGDAMLII